jgi:hypothetical protein
MKISTYQRTKPILLLGSFLATACTAGGGSDDAATGSSEGAVESSGASGVSDSSGSSGGETGPSVPPNLPDIDGVEFVAAVDNPYLPFPVGMIWDYDAAGEEGVEHIHVEVLAETRDIQGVVATVVRDTATLNDQVIEDTWDWYAQDADGNVWYLGEDTCEFEDGMCVNTVGAWEWGVEGALPGIVMPAHPAVDGQPYYQEYQVGEAEDAGEVIEIGSSVDVMAGHFDDCVKTHDTSTFDLTANEYKYYCRDIGLVLTEEPDVDEELVQYQVP